MSRAAAVEPPAAATDLPLDASFMPHPETDADFPVADGSDAVAAADGGFADVSFAETRWRLSK